MSRWRNAKIGILWIGLLIPIVLYGSVVWRRPKPIAINRQSLFQGISYSRRVNNRPRPYIAHIVNIDLTTAGIQPFVTQPYAGLELTKKGLFRSYKTRAQRTSEFLETHDLQLAINANFFLPFKDVTPWYYEPRTGQQINLVGLSMSDGEIITPVNPNNKPPPPALCFTRQQAVVKRSGTCGSGTEHAVAGDLLLLENGQTTDLFNQELHNKGDKPYPLTVAALDKTGTRLWLVLVDGKQPFYSEGLTLEELAALVQGLEADTAIRLDGGGSTTLAITSPIGAQLLNVPIHSKVPGYERPVGNHLGFFAEPLE